MSAGERQRYVVIGLGGVGGLLLRLLVPFLRHEGRPGTVLAVDGDQFEERNRERMLFRELGPKAVVLARELADACGDEIAVVPVVQHVTPQRARFLIEDGDVVFCQPDNHATRLVVERRCARLASVALFSGGNDGVENGEGGSYGNVQIYLRSRGRDLTNRLSAYHPEIARPADRLPTARGCAATLPSAPQLLFTNAAVAAAQLGAFYAWSRGRLTHEERYFDVVTGRSVPVRRALR